MSFKNLDKIKLKDRYVLLRSDLNADIVHGSPFPSQRFTESAKTIALLKKKGAKVVILAHQGQPSKDYFTSLKKHAALLSKYTKVKFVPDVIGKKAIKAIKDLKQGDALLLENIRFEKDEYHPEKGKRNKIIKALLPFFSLYVNDAFSVSHRNHTSMVSFPQKLPSAIGKTLEKELEGAKKVKSSGSLFILGGNKPEDLLPLLKKKKILVAGTLSILALMASGFVLGKEKKLLKGDLKFLPKIKPYLKNLKLPEDLAIQKGKERVELPLSEFPQDYPIYDIGSNTIEKYRKEIKKAKSIFFKGTPGHTGIPGFDKSTKILLKALAKSKAHTVVAGGHSSTALEKYKINKNHISHISLSGGALVAYISGKKLPALEALKKCKKDC